LPLNSLVKALKELTYEHIVFSKRIEELKSLINSSPLNGVEEFINFLENIVFPHRAREENDMFPVILTIGEREVNNKSTKDLIDELIKDHKEMEKHYENFRKNLSNGKTSIILFQIREILNSLKTHIEKEEPLHQLLLKKVLKNL